MDRGRCRRLPATFTQTLSDRLGQFVRLMLVDPVGTEKNQTLFPTGRLVAVGTDYVALDDVHIAGAAVPELGVLDIARGYILGVAGATAGGPGS